MTYLLFPLPTQIAAIANEYQSDPYYSNLFDGNSLKVKIHPANKYIPMFEGTETEYIEGISTEILNLGCKRYGFEVRLQDGRQATYRILAALIANSVSDPCSAKDIECWDFVEDEGEATGYKVRLGRIADLKKKGGVTTRIKYGQKRKLTQGITFQFLEREKRFIGR